MTDTDTKDAKRDDSEDGVKRIIYTYPLIKQSDMPEEMKTETVELCVTACEKYANNNESAARMVKETLDKKYGLSWHVVVGESYGLEVTHEGSADTKWKHIINVLYNSFVGFRGD